MSQQVGGQEGESRIDPRRRRGQADESTGPGRVAAAVTGEEEPRQRLREPAAVVRIGDEGPPGPRHALAAAKRLGRQPREDLDDELVRDREDGRSRCGPAASSLHLDGRGAAEPAIHAAAPG